MPAEDAEATRRVRALITRRSVDSSMLDVRVAHGVIYLRGNLMPLRDHAQIDLAEEAAHIIHILRQHPGIRDVVWDMPKRH